MESSDDSIFTNQELSPKLNKMSHRSKSLAGPKNDQTSFEEIGRLFSTEEITSRLEKHRKSLSVRRYSVAGNINVKDGVGFLVFYL